jgi:hypothetical protein
MPEGLVAAKAAMPSAEEPEKAKAMESVGGDAVAASGAQPAVEETKPALAGHDEHPVLAPPKE